ncbi:glycosyl hydrolase family 8 [Amorphus orientalis]|uniref:Glucanase n=1 Tax=Amorphus orientalis TaxID=649198 RepID=A0AAE3VRD0_9HYPH|nr:glycosyl hydrolase family 8 [Amorphus orientalis]MDQ0316924.1 endoglucanase [Amorphus orientalis]
MDALTVKPASFGECMLQRTVKRLALCLASLGLLLQPLPALAQIDLDAIRTNAITSDEWARYARAYVQPSGRVVDFENGQISHSEGQGYGMLLAVEAGARPDFERIWSFARDEMRMGPGPLFYWKWNPFSVNPIEDPNDASDGDILIAYALLLAGLKWEEPAFVDEAAAIIGAVADQLVYRRREATLLSPGIRGFGEQDQPDGPIVNLSYWIYPAFPYFNLVLPDPRWRGLIETGLGLTAASGAGRSVLPPNWSSVANPFRPQPAGNFPPLSSYDAVRIPLYLLFSGVVPREQLVPFDRAWNGPGGQGPAVINVRTGAVLSPMPDPGYKAVAALVACALRGTRVPDDLTRFRTTTYYASTLHLLTLSVLRRHFSGCL